MVVKERYLSRGEYIPHKYATYVFHTGMLCEESRALLHHLVPRVLLCCMHFRVQRSYNAGRPISEDFPTRSKVSALVWV